MTQRALPYLLSLALSLLSAAVVRAESAATAWLDDYDAAVAQAARENKTVLINFTGSDWCGWCIRLDRDTFTKPEFSEFARENLVLLKVDFPRKTQLAAEVAARNEQLSQRFGVEGFPTLVLVDSSGKELVRNVGYLAGGPEALANWVRGARGKP